MCEKCGLQGQDYDTAHIISRKNLTLRWDILNVLCLCRGCHMYAHANPKFFATWFRNKYPDRQEYLDSTRNKILKRSIEDYEKILESIDKKDFIGLIQLSDT